MEETVCKRMEVNMKIYSITNGYIGDEILKVLVCADSEERALELAKERFKEEMERNLNYNEDFYNNLTVLDVFDNLNEEWASKFNQLDNH